MSSYIMLERHIILLSHQETGETEKRCVQPVPNGLQRNFAGHVTNATLFDNLEAQEYASSESAKLFCLFLWELPWSKSVVSIVLRPHPDFTDIYQRIGLNGHVEPSWFENVKRRTLTIR